MNSVWRNDYASLQQYYAENFKQTYKILDPVTLQPVDDKVYPCYTLEPDELVIDPDEDPRDWDISPRDSIELKKWKLDRQNDEIIKCVRSFPYFCHRFVKIIHPIRGVVPFVLFNYQRRVIQDYENHRRNIIAKMRQAGLTTVTSLWSLWRGMFRKSQIMAVMSKTDREAMTAAGIVQTAVEWLPDWMKPTMGKDNEHIKEFLTTNSKIEFHGPEAARSKALTYLILDEAAHIPGMESKWNAMQPTLSTGGKCIALSTVNGLGNWYQEIYYDAQSGKNGWHIIEIDFWEHPDYNDPVWVANQRAELSEDGWKQEVLRSFLGGGQTFIPAEIISDIDLQVRDNYPTRIKFPEWANEKEDFFEEKGALYIWREPIDGHEYVLSVDAASGLGEKTDSSCFQIIDQATLEQVAEFYSNRIPPHIFAPIINEVGIYYNTALVIVENMAPEGGAVLASLEKTLIYENLYYDPKKRRQAGLKMNVQSRGLVLEALQQKILQRQLIVNSPRFVHELKTFIFDASRKRPQAQRGKHDDAVMAMAIALYVISENQKDIPVGAHVPQEMLNVFKTEVYEQIKREIKDGAPENWVEEEDDLLDIYSDTVTPGVVFNVRRKYDNLLREFDW